MQKQRKEVMPMVPFQKITEACKTTGLSQYFLRQGCSMRDRMFAR